MHRNFGKIPRKSQSSKHWISCWIFAQALDNLAKSQNSFIGIFLFLLMYGNRVLEEFYTWRIIQKSKLNRKGSLNACLMTQTCSKVHIFLIRWLNVTWKQRKLEQLTIPIYLKFFLSVNIKLTFCECAPVGSGFLCSIIWFQWNHNLCNHASILYVCDTYHVNTKSQEGELVKISYLANGCTILSSSRLCFLVGSKVI